MDTVDRGEVRLGGQERNRRIVEMKKQEELAILYQKLAEQYLFEMYSVRRLDERFGECEPAFVPEDAEKPGDELSLRFISLLNEAHIERLDENERQVLEEIGEGNERRINIADFMAQTYEKVLAGDLRPNTQYEYFKNIYGRSILPGNAIIFVLRDKRDGLQEEKKTWIFNNVKKQFEELANRNAKSPVYLMRI